MVVGLITLGFFLFAIINSLLYFLVEKYMWAKMEVVCVVLLNMSWSGFLASFVIWVLLKLGGVEF